MLAPFGWEQIKKFYGWEERFLTDLKSWEARMVVVEAPPGCHFYYDANGDGIEGVKERARGIRVHPAIAGELSACLKEIKDTGLWRFVECEAGGYNFRAQRGSDKISMHSLGAAIDFDPLRNPFRVDPRHTSLGTEPGLGVVRIFENRGWTWGGNFARPDAMHIQFAGGF